MTYIVNSFNWRESELGKYLLANVVGQDNAVEELVKQYYRVELGMHDTTKPFANVLLLGPTGVGKTLLVDKFSEWLFGVGESGLVVNCGEFQSSHEITKLQGSPPGYLGHRETMAYFASGNIFRLINQPKSGINTRQAQVILFDEVEKASDGLHKLLLGIMDKGTFTLGTNELVDMKSTFIFLTSNLGAEKFSAGVGLGFTTGDKDKLKSFGDISSSAVEAAKKKFAPEFWNRLDGVVVCNVLTQDVMENIVYNELRKIAERFASRFILQTSKDVAKYLAERSYSSIYGARELKRLIEKEVLQPLVGIILSKNDTPAIQIVVKDNALRFKVGSLAKAAKKGSK